MQMAKVVLKAGKRPPHHKALNTCRTAPGFGIAWQPRAPAELRSDYLKMRWRSEIPGKCRSAEDARIQTANVYNRFNVINEVVDKDWEKQTAEDYIYWFPCRRKRQWG